MTNKRGIPSISDYAHWNEDAALMWYQENRYDMEHADEIDYDDYYNDGTDNIHEEFSDEGECCDNCGEDYIGYHVCAN